MIIYDPAPHSIGADHRTIQLERSEAARLLRGWRRQAGAYFIEREVDRKAKAKVRYTHYSLRLTYGDRLQQHLMVRTLLA